MSTLKAGSREGLGGAVYPSSLLSWTVVGKKYKVGEAVGDPVGDPVGDSVGDPVGNNNKDSFSSESSTSIKSAPGCHDDTKHERNRRATRKTNMVLVG